MLEEQGKGKKKAKFRNGLQRLGGEKQTGEGDLGSV